MKKLLSLAIATCLTASSFVCVHAAKTFSDVENDSTVAWAKSYISDMVKKGYVSGYEDGTYRPYNEVTRQEMLTLMARVLGCNNKANAKLLADAVEKNGEKIKDLELSWGTDEISWLVYRGVLTDSDLTTYLKGSAKSQPMKRYEAAVIMTKAMAAEQLANESKYELNYSDSTMIPASASKYVKYTSEVGLLTGMGDNEFSPNTSVVRSQIAVILSRIDDKLKLTYQTVKIDEISKTELTYTANDETATVDILPNGSAFVMGKPSTFSDVTAGVEAIITFSGDDVLFVDTLTSVPDETFEGRFISKTTGQATKLTVRRFDTDFEKIYTCADDFSVTYQGSPATLASFQTGDWVTLTLRNEKITEVNGQPKTLTISDAKLTDFEYDPVVKLTISCPDKAYDGKSLYVADSVTVTKDTLLDKSLSDLYIGDSLTLTLEYGKVTNINARASKSSANGVIKSITFAAQSSMIVSANGKDTEYIIPNEVTIKIDGKEGTLYDLRVGQSVTIGTESNAIKTISTTAAQSSSGTITGVVTSVNTSYGFIKVVYTNADGYEIEETVYCSDSKTTIMNNNATTKKLKDIKVGATVTATGTVANGAFSAKVLTYIE